MSPYTSDLAAALARVAALTLALERATRANPPSLGLTQATLAYDQSSPLWEWVQRTWGTVYGSADSPAWVEVAAEHMVTGELPVWAAARLARAEWQVANPTKDPDQSRSFNADFGDYRDHT